jgi:hypothetical protein
MAHEAPLRPHRHVVPGQQVKEVLPAARRHARPPRRRSTSTATIKLRSPSLMTTCAVGSTPRPPAASLLFPPPRPTRTTSSHGILNFVTFYFRFMIFYAMFTIYLIQSISQWASSHGRTGCIGPLDVPARRARLRRKMCPALDANGSERTICVGRMHQQDASARWRCPHLVQLM